MWKSATCVFFFQDAFDELDIIELKIHDALGSIDVGHEKVSRFVLVRVSIKSCQLYPSRTASACPAEAQELGFLDTCHLT